MISKVFSLSSNEIRSSGGFAFEEKVGYDLRELVETFSAKGIFLIERMRQKRG